MFSSYTVAIYAVYHVILCSVICKNKLSALNENFVTIYIPFISAALKSCGTFCALMLLLCLCIHFYEEQFLLLS